MVYLQVAELYFSFADSLDFLAQRTNYEPFVVKDLKKEENILFKLDVDCNLKQTIQNAKFTYTNEIGCYGVICKDQTYEWILKKADSEECYLMQLNIDTKEAFINFNIKDAFTMQAADDFTRFAFIYTAAFHHTVLLHASSIKYNKKGIAFMGRSGIGKSTHSSLWLKFLQGSELLNDDQPAVGVKDNGIIIYGTPWSGKTMCYKNTQAQLKAIVCMEQKPFNRLNPINKMVLFTHLLSACSLIKTEKNTLRSILQTLAEISEQVHGAILQNKPEKEAFLLSYEFLQNQSEKTMPMIENKK